MRKEEVTILWFIIIFVLAIVAIKEPLVIVLGVIGYCVYLLYKHYNR